MNIDSFWRNGDMEALHLTQKNEYQLLRNLNKETDNIFSKFNEIFNILKIADERQMRFLYIPATNYLSIYIERFLISNEIHDQEKVDTLVKMLEANLDLLGKIGDQITFLAYLELLTNEYSISNSRDEIEKAKDKIRLRIEALTKDQEN